MRLDLLPGVQLRAPAGSHAAQDRVLGGEAVAFLAELERRFGPRRRELLAAREKAQARYDAGALPQAPDIPEARGEWQVPPPPADLADRRVEITGPTDRKMMINALNSGANCFMADFEDATSPTWQNLLSGQANLEDFARGSLELTTPERTYRVGTPHATLLVRPRGWHLDEKHLEVDGTPMSGSLFDAGLFLFHCAKRLLARGSGPYLYLPKMEHHLEARLWDEALSFAEARLAIPAGSVRTTTLIETLPGAIQMEEILYELRRRACGLNAGRWDYLFSTLKVLRERPRPFPDRSDLSMQVPFLRAYAQRIVHVCHRHGAHAMGGMAAFIPSRRDPEVNARAIQAVVEDKDREAGMGFDGTWVAHPDLVAAAGASFDHVLGNRPNQTLRQVPSPSPADLLDFDRLPGRITLAGARHNVRASLLYTAHWLAGTGAVAIDNLMEDAATAEISRTQLWHWLRHKATLEDGSTFDKQLLKRLVASEMDGLAAEGAPKTLPEARELVESLVLADKLAPFLTSAAYPQLE